MIDLRQGAQIDDDQRFYLPDQVPRAGFWPSVREQSNRHFERIRLETARRPMRLKTAAYWTIPQIFSVLLYWPGLLSWFQMDDFVWLGLHGMVHNWGDFRTVMLQPYAQGTLRTFSERAFFLVFHVLFGMNALPYRGWAFLTQAANLVLIALVCAKLTRSRAAGFWAAILWTANSVMAFALAWTAIYHELLCSLCFLAGIWFLIRRAETGQTRYLAAQWITFLFGFGVLEQNVIYPALALAYALCCARPLLPKAVPMFLVSAVYAGWHLSLARFRPAAITGCTGTLRYFQLFGPTGKSPSARANLSFCRFIPPWAGQLSRRC